MGLLGSEVIEVRIDLKLIVWRLVSWNVGEAFSANFVLRAEVELPRVLGSHIQNVLLSASIIA